MRSAGAPALDSQSHVKHDTAVRRAPDRIEVSLDHLGDLPEQQGKAQDQLAQRHTIERSGAPEPVQLSGGATAGINQLVGLDIGRRWHAERYRVGQRRLDGRRGRPRSRSPDRGRRRPTTSTSAPGATRRWTIAPVHSCPAAHTRRSSSRHPDRTAGVALQPEQRGVNVARMCGSREIRLQRDQTADFLRRRDGALEIAAALRGDQPGFRGWPAEPLPRRAKASRLAGSRSSSPETSARAAVPVQAGVARRRAERPRQPGATFGRAREHGGTRIGEQEVLGTPESFLQGQRTCSIRPHRRMPQPAWTVPLRPRRSRPERPLGHRPDGRA